MKKQNAVIEFIEDSIYLSTYVKIGKYALGPPPLNLHD